MKLVFDEKKHQYSYGDTVLASVTQIAGFLLNINFDGIPPDILKKAADKGSLVHSEIEQFEKTGEAGFTPHFAEYLTLKTENPYKVIKAEQSVLSINGIADFAGMYDQLIEIDGKQYIADIKTTAKVHTDALKIQLSLYNYALDLAADVGYCVWLRGDKHQFIPIQLYSKTEINGLLKLYSEGKRLPIEPMAELQTVSETELDILYTTLAKIKETEDRIESIKMKILEEMQTRNIEQIKIKDMTVSYIAGSTRKSLDSKKLKEDEPEIYERYTKTTETKPSIRIKI